MIGNKALALKVIQENYVLKPGYHGSEHMWVFKYLGWDRQYSSWACQY